MNKGEKWIKFFTDKGWLKNNVIAAGEGEELQIFINLGDLSTQAAKANAVIDAKAFSWTRLFNQLEGVMPYDVRMVSVRPQFAFGRRGRRQSEGVPEGAVPVAVEGVARNMRALWDFERNLFDGERSMADHVPEDLCGESLMAIEHLCINADLLLCGERLERSAHLLDGL